ncbi:hypothetical protein K8R14_04925 [bacterium]|nr:hypothetical protein [bacterium]
MSKFKNIYKSFLCSKYLPIVFFVLWFVFFIILSLFRDVRLDENIYLGESAVIADLLKNGQWIGNYGVGLHGFLSKLLVGVIFIFSGPSVFIATLINILFGIGSGIVFYRILNGHFKLSQIYSLLGVTLLFSSYQFVTYMPTFYRDIQALFFVLLIFNSILSKKSKWWTGVFLLLLLDSKEHVFYTFGPALVIWVIIESLMMYKGNWKKILESTVLSCIQLFLPALVYLVLMFTTSIIPLNIYNANILGLIERGTRELTRNFGLELATYNRDIATNVGVARAMFLINIPENVSPFLGYLYVSINIVLQYIGKIFYPRTFSFFSIPFLMLVPSLSYLTKSFKSYFKEKNIERMFLPILLFTYLLIYIFHSSIGRYLIPITPIIIVYFLLFLKNIKQKEIFVRNTILVTIVFVIGGMYFEYSYVWIKVVFSLFIIVGFLMMYYIEKGVIKYIIEISLSIFMVGTALLASYKHGQIESYLLYGYNRECEEILSLVDEDEVIWINNIGWDRLPFVLRSENVQDPEWRWKLKEWIPKKELLVQDIDIETYNFRIGGLENFENMLAKTGVSELVYISLHEGKEEDLLLNEDRLQELLDSTVLDLEERIDMKHKTIHLFKYAN